MYQLTAIDVFTRWAFVAIVLGPPNGDMTARFIDQAAACLSAPRGAGSGPILSDNGPEYIAGAFIGALAAKGLAPRSASRPARPTTTPWCERFHGTILQECWRPAFHRRHFTSIRQLQAEADAWLITYNRRRRNHGDYMRGRTPQEILDNHKRNKAA